MSILPDDFDVNAYRILNNDLINLNNEELIKHYLCHGVNEGRQYKYNLPEYFNVNSYRDLNNDIKDFNNDELIQHYLYHGIHDRRQYKHNLPEGFDVDFYRNLNSDLNELNDKELIKHYLFHGINEDRKYKYNLPEDFDINIYRDLNSDLNELDNNQLINHYLNHGINEKRSYKYDLPDDFDINTYLLLNNDLIELNNGELVRHYIQYGLNEGRHYKTNSVINNFYKNFNWKLYVDINNFNHINTRDEALENCIRKLDNISLYSNNNLLIYESININNFLLENKKISNKLEAFKHIIGYKNINYYETFFINNIELIDKNVNFNNKISNIIISLSILPNRILVDEFDKCLIFLSNQLLKPKYIIINYCIEYTRIKKYDKTIFLNKIEYFKNKYKNIIFNESLDYGPITKALGIISLPIDIKNNIDDNDKIIIIDDDWKYNNLLTYYHNICYDIYQCDAIFIDEKKIINWTDKLNLTTTNEIFYDNYSGSAYGWLSFSFKYKYLSELYDLYNELLELDNNIFYHDDLVFTIFYKKLKLYSCGINLFFPINDYRILEYIDGLRLMNESHKVRYNLEKKFLSLYNILYDDDLDFNIKIKENSTYENNFIIDKNIKKRDLLYEINEISYLPIDNNYENYHFDLKYTNSNVFLITITNFSDIIEDITFMFEYNNTPKTLYIDKFNSKKISFFISSSFYITPISHYNREEKIIQTYNTNNISRNKYYSICTILNKLPDFEYIFFNEDDRLEFINNNFPNIITLYEKVNNGAYKADLFRAMYLYKNGGLYFDCKNILYNNLKNILDEDEAYARDYNNGVCNGFIYTKNSYNEIIKKYLLEILYNFYKNKYFECNEWGSLEICGPQCFSKFIINNYNIKLYCFFENNNWKNSTFINNYENKNILIKISYNGYYDENNYINTGHYDTMWKNRTIYNDTIINYDKINCISAIAWINLDRSVNRKTNMENILKNINIPNYRISAVDGKNTNLKDLLNNVNIARNMNNFEIACTLSHIKSITFLSELDGDYFMVCEDDIQIRNINFIKNNLNDIINKSPNFDILMLHKIYIDILNEDYTNWNDHIDRLGENYQIGGTACYIISRSGIDKLIKISKFIDIDNFSYDKLFMFDVSDMFLFKNTNTFVYKYNYFSVSGLDSNIHDNHITHHNKCEEVQDRYVLSNNL